MPIICQFYGIIIRMYYDIQKAEVIKPYEISVTFVDGKAGMVRFVPEFFTGVFAPLHDFALFQKASLDCGALSWPCNVDIAPDSLHRTISQHGEAVLR